MACVRPPRKGPMLRHRMADSNPVSADIGQRPEAATNSIIKRQTTNRTGGISEVQSSAVLFSSLRNRARFAISSEMLSHWRIGCEDRWQFIILTSTRVLSQSVIMSMNPGANRFRRGSSLSLL